MSSFVFIFLLYEAVISAVEGQDYRSDDLEGFWKGAVIRNE